VSRTLTPLLVGVAVLVLLLYLFQGALLYHPRRYPEDPARMLPARGEVLALGLDGDRQHAYWLPGPLAGPPDPVFFVFGGNATLALDWLDWVDALQRRRPRLSFVLVEYPGYGASGGKPSRASMLRVAHAARGRLRTLLGVAEAALASRTRVLAHSIGAGVGLEFAREAGAAEVVLVAPFTTLVDMARSVVGWPLCLLARDRWDNAARLRELALSPARPAVRIYHGAADEVIPVRMGRALAAPHAGWVRYEEWPGVGHNDVFEPLLERLSAEEPP
jgi:pimeloyl-ACP methyl ester carboxylesterase